MATANPANCCGNCPALDQIPIPNFKTRLKLCVTYVNSCVATEVSTTWTMVNTGTSTDNSKQPLPSVATISGIGCHIEGFYDPCTF